MATPQKDPCICSHKGCPRHGNCPACQAHHHSKDQPTYCERRRARAQKKPLFPPA